MPTQLSISNLALRRIRATLIDDINENSNEAQNCAALYPVIVAKALEGPHRWSFANQRVRLAPQSANDRSFEWVYAYKLPANCAAPMRILPDWASAGEVAPIPVPNIPWQDRSGLHNIDTLPYEIEGQTLYCNAENAWLEYVINDISGVPETNLFADAVSYELAAELAVPIKGDAQLEASNRTKTELAWQRAVAADENRQPQSYGDFVSEAMIARHSEARDCDW